MTLQASRRYRSSRFPDRSRVLGSRAAALAGAILLLVLGVPPAVLAQQSQGPRLGGEEPSLDLGPAPERDASDAASPATRPSGNPGPDLAPRSPDDGANAVVAPVITPHRDWDVACAPQGGNCIMTQEGEDQKGNTALRIMIERLEDPQEVEDQVVVAVIDIVTPLGVVLNAGLSFQVDQGQVSRAPFQICTVEGCLVREPVTQDVIDRMRRGNVAAVAFVVANYGEVSSDLSLSGFTSAYESLQ